MSPILSRVMAVFCSVAPLVLFADSLSEQEIPTVSTLPQTIDLTIPAPDLWTRIRNGFAMPDLNHDLVWRHQQQYLAQPDYLRRMVERSRPYLHYVVEMLEARGMPLELALLPMVESAYNPFASSSAEASGLWQFIPSTGRSFELEQNWWRDQRRDVLASTRAALDYLQYVYEMHGDWHLALAAYNWGEGAVGRMIARNRAKKLPADYANLDLPNETRNYVPKLQALKNIFGNPALCAELQLPDLPNRPYFRTLTIRAPLDISLAARFAGMSATDFFALNPGYNRPVIPPQSTLLIPDDRLEEFNKGLRWHPEPLSSWGVYALNNGEDLAKVATRFGMNLEDLKRVNSLTGNTKPALALLVPQGDKTPSAKAGELDERAFSALARQDLQPVLKQSNSSQTHQVKKGETLAGIVRRYKISLAELKKANNLKSDRLRVGARLIIHGRRASAASGQHPALFSLRSGATPAAQIGDLPTEEAETRKSDEADQSPPAEPLFADDSVIPGSAKP
ncbi:MAG: transglycosylase SLT domain-containing protein [Betaproteobacteria bacterium]|nr:transglycosylase SLT domain-containing protein [Betaproteobacteria bacterium]